MALEAVTAMAALSNIGLGVAGNAVYDVLKTCFTGGKSVETEQLRAEIQNAINMNGVKVNASTVIEALAKHGVLNIVGSQLFAPDSVTIGAAGGRATFGHGSTSTTNTTSVVTGGGAYVEMTGNAQMRQNPDGSISILT